MERGKTEGEQKVGRGHFSAGNPEDWMEVEEAPVVRSKNMKDQFTHIGSLIGSILEPMING